MDKVKEKYNENLKRINKAFLYFDRKDISLEDKETQLERFKGLLGEQNKLINAIGLQVGEKEVLEGFEGLTE